MKKPGQSKSAKRSSRIQRQERRNFQVGGTKRTSVHLPQADKTGQAPDEAARASSRAKNHRKRPNSRMIDLRVEQATRRMVASMGECAGASFETHCDAIGLGLSTFYEWMGRGVENPESCYGKFRTEMVKAMAQGEKQPHNKAMRTHAIHLLSRRFPSHYPSERQLLEVSAPGGLPPIPSENPFHVVIELDPRDEQLLPEKQFTLVHPDGRAEMIDGIRGNGLEPPPPLQP